MMFSLGISILVGMIIPIMYNRIIKKSLVVKGYHFHHTSHGLISSLSSVPLIFRDVFGGIQMMGLGLGVMVHHLFSEKNLKLFDKIK